MSLVPPRAAVPPHPAARRWNDDWNRLAQSPRLARALARWAAEDDAPFVDSTALLAATGAGAATPTADHDACLGRFVARAGHDPLAGRVVLQRVLPGLVAIARRRALCEGCSIGAALDDLVATAWTVIVTYPLARRPAKYAVNIVLDAEYLCFVRPRRLRRVDEHLVGTDLGGVALPPCELDGRRAGVEANASELTNALLDYAERAGLSPADAGLLRALYLEGRPLGEVAAEHAIGARALRYRRRAAVDRLARLAA